MNRADDTTDPVEEYSTEYADILARAESWLTPPEGADPTDPATPGDGQKEEDDWKEWILLLFLASTVKTGLKVASDSVAAEAWQAARAATIRQIAITTSEGIVAALDLDPSGGVARLAYGLAAQQVATIRNLIAAMQAEGATTESIAKAVAKEAARLRSDRAALIAEYEVVTGDAGATLSAWRTAISSGLVGNATKTWRAYALGNICEVCAELDGQTAGIDQPFTTTDGNEYDGPAIHPRCRCRLKIKEEAMKVSRSDYTMPAPGAMTPETVPPALLAGMGPVASAFFASTWNAFTNAGLASGQALYQATCCMWMAGFCRQVDGTWTRDEGFEAEQAEYAKYYEPSGVMRSDAPINRAGKVLSAANAETLRKVCRGMDEHMGQIVGLLESCGYPMTEEPVAESTEPAEISIQVNRSDISGGEVTAWLSVAKDSSGKEVFDQHGTNFPVEILHRAVDEAAAEGRIVGMDDEHGVPIDGFWSQLLVVDDAVAKQILDNPLKRGLMGKGIVRSPELRNSVKAGEKNAASIEGSARFVKA